MMIKWELLDHLHERYYLEPEKLLSGMGKGKLFTLIRYKDYTSFGDGKFIYNLLRD